MCAETNMAEQKKSMNVRIAKVVCINLNAAREHLGTVRYR